MKVVVETSGMLESVTTEDNQQFYEILAFCNME